ncbi:MAG TPA: shikimate kinase [Hellea balneolensis]|uniref:Shikimate kinase n=1 Tax=Hellea balneolensis TaxID=287478 RepID=A0A7C5R853_9PROT|nr:shikimate kinase [Hellea balneolensis]
MTSDLRHIRTQTIALVGLMGVGKTTIGRRLAKRLEMPFYDTDDEIEKASGRTVKGYFKDYGEEAFRAGEYRVIDRLLGGAPMVLATGGGAFIPENTRALLNTQAITVWLKADFDTIFDRVSRKNTRPLLDVDDPKSALRHLMDVRYPIYAQATLTVPAGVGSHSRTVNAVINALEAYFDA